MLSLTLTIVTLFTAVLYYYIKRVYFTLLGPIPGVPPQFLFGNLLQTGVIWRDVPLNTVFIQLKDKLGDVFQFWLGPTRIIAVSRLEDVQHIFAHRHVYDQGDAFVKKVGLINSNALVSLKGAKYKRHSSVISSLFRGSKINGHLDTVFDCTDKLLARWRTYNGNPSHIHLNMIEQSQQLLLSIFGLIAFNYDFLILENKNNTDKNELISAFHTYMRASMMLTKLPTVVGRIYLSLNLEYQRARTIIDQYLQRMIEQQLRETSIMRAEHKKRSLIGSLVASLQQDEELEATKPEEEKKGFSQTEVMGELLFFMSAGHITTSSTLVWFIYFMSKRSEVQSKLKRELAEYSLQRLSAEQLHSLTYLDCVLRELLRFVPPVVATVRTLTVDDRLPASGFHLSKGEQVLIPIYNLSRDPRYWSGSMSPDEFHPERFLIDAEENNNNAALMAFGGGHRQCIGQDLAWLELKAICARLMQHVTFGDGGPEVNAGGYKQTDTIMPKHMGVTITFD